MALINCLMPCALHADGTLQVYPTEPALCGSCVPCHATRHPEPLNPIPWISSGATPPDPSAAAAHLACRRHAVGSIGVEFAGGDAVLAALAHAAPAFPPSRREFSTEELVGRGLMNAHGATPTPGTLARRRLLCQALGLHDSTGASLTTQLNRYFTRERFEQAVSGLPGAPE